MQYKVVLYKNTSIPFLDTVNQILLATNFEFEECNQLATAINIVGKFPIYKGTFKECYSVCDILKQLNLKSEIIR